VRRRPVARAVTRGATPNQARSPIPYVRTRGGHGKSTGRIWRSTEATHIYQRQVPKRCRAGSGAECGRSSPAAALLPQQVWARATTHRLCQVRTFFTPSRRPASPDATRPRLARRRPLGAPLGGGASGCPSAGLHAVARPAGRDRSTQNQEPGSWITGQTKLLTTPISVAAPASNAAATSSSLSKSPLSLVSNAATAAA
jgi:hypothetical protein